MSETFTYEFVKRYFDNFGFELLDKEYINNRQRLTIKDKEGYFYNICFDNFKSGKRPRIADARSDFSIINIKNWLKVNNKKFTIISEKYVNKDSILQWKCLKEECGEIFEMSWHNVFKGQNCSVCRGLQVGLSNYLATKNPKVSKEWHPTKNGDLTPFDVTCGCNKYAWWKCEKGHEWNAIISSREINNCPYCSTKIPSQDYNLLICEPDLCREWNYSKNDKLPSEYCPNSNQTVSWICRDCGHEWNAPIGNRSNGRTRCPRCSISCGEEFVASFLKRFDVPHILQYKFEDCKHKRNLPYDFYLPTYNLCIEYQGIQHYEPIKYFGGQSKFESQQVLDQIKRDYCKNNNIGLLEIPYWDFDIIDEILIKELNINEYK